MEFYNYVTVLTYDLYIMYVYQDKLKKIDLEWKSHIDIHNNNNMNDDLMDRWIIFIGDGDAPFFYELGLEIQVRLKLA